MYKNIKKIIHAVCIISLFLAIEISFAQQPNKVVIYKTIDTLKLKLFIFTPVGASKEARYPCIVLFHGGGWNNGSPKSFFKQAAYLASRGMIAISAQYRLRDSNGTTPKECVMDGKSAMRWVRKNADDLGINPNMIAAGGGSAGGHVAAAAATLTMFDEESDDASISCKPAALVLFNPVIDNGPEGYGYKRVEEYWKEFSPMHNITKGMPPTLFMVGTKDHLIPVATSEKFKSEIEKVGSRCDLVLYEGEEHAFYHKSKFKETIFEMDKFLTSLGYLSGSPSTNID